MHFVIVGGDAAGMSAASRARRLVPDMEVTVLEQTGDVSYSACNMPYNIADPQRDMDDLVVRTAGEFRRRHGIDVRLHHRVTVVDVAGSRVLGRDADGVDFQVSFDRLLIATGASPRMPDLPGVDLPGVMALKRLADGRAIKEFLRRHVVKRVAILGMGYIAMEMAEALRRRDISVAMVKPRSRLLPWLESGLADRVAQSLAQNGVDLHMDRTVERIDRDDGGLRVVAGDLRLSVDMVLVAMGVRPNSELAAAAGLDLGPAGAIAVDRGLRTSTASIYAAGDCADAFHVVSGQRVWIPLALRANRAGWAVADGVAGRPADLSGIAGTAVFKVFDLEVARTGLTGAEAEQTGFEPRTVTITSETRSGLYPGAEPILVHLVGDRPSGRLLGAQMVARESAAHRINAAAVALHAGMTVADFLQCDLAYAPPFGGVWDPLLVAANQLIKEL